jgi:hypothetical protein
MSEFLAEIQFNDVEIPVENVIHFKAQGVIS